MVPNYTLRLLRLLLIILLQLQCFLPCGASELWWCETCRSQQKLHDSWSWHNIVKQLTGQELPTPPVVNSKQTFNVVALWLVLLLHSIEVTDSNRKHIFSVRFCNSFSKMLANIRIVSFLLFSQHFTFNPHVIPHPDIYNQGSWGIVVQYTMRLLIYLLTYSTAWRRSESFGLLF